MIGVSCFRFTMIMPSKPAIYRSPHRAFVNQIWKSNQEASSRETSTPSSVDSASSTLSHEGPSCRLNLFFAEGRLRGDPILVCDISHGHFHLPSVEFFEPSAERHIRKINVEFHLQRSIAKQITRGVFLVHGTSSYSKLAMTPH